MASIPVLAHGSLNGRFEIDAFLSHTGVDAVVATTELLHEPDFFAAHNSSCTKQQQEEGSVGAAQAAVEGNSALSAVDTSDRYLSLFRKHLTFPLFARWHLVHLLHAALLHCPDLIDDVHNGEVLVTAGSRG